VTDFGALLLCLCVICKYAMNRDYQCRRKLVHLDATMCAEISNTADDSKCLREPMAVSARDSKISCGLIRRPSYKSVKSCNQNFKIPGISEFNCVCV